MGYLTSTVNRLSGNPYFKFSVFKTIGETKVKLEIKNRVWKFKSEKALKEALWGLYFIFIYKKYGRPRANSVKRARDAFKHSTYIGKSSNNIYRL